MTMQTGMTDMRVDTAISLIEDLVFLPGWEIRAEDHTKRFEDTICLHFTYPAVNTDRENAPDYTETIDGGARAAYHLYVGDVSEPTELYGRVLDQLGKVFLHEAREALRVAPTWWAPFHPHKRDGMERWATRTGGSVSDDYLYGVV